MDSPSFDSLEGKGVPYLDAVASRSSDGKQIFIKTVNTDLVKPLKVIVKLAGVKVAPGAQIETLTAESLAAANSFSTPDAVSVLQSPLRAGSMFDISLPPHSVSVITLGCRELGSAVALRAVSRVSVKWEAQRDCDQATSSVESEKPPDAAV